MTVKFNIKNMNTKKYMSILSALACVSIVGMMSCGSDEDSKDMTYPEISGQGITPNPVDCQQYKRGEVIPVDYILTDNEELGAFNIEIHSNSDHHSHSTSPVECEEHEHEDEHKEAVKPWVFNESHNIPAGQRKFEVRQDIVIPEDIDAGDYHFMLRVTDRAGWQQLKAVSIEITE